MRNEPRGPPGDRLLSRLQRAFLDFGYEQPTMADLARACGVTRRTLYNHFNNKEDAFRAQLRWGHGIEIAAGFEAGTYALARGGSAVDTVIAIMDARYGETRRNLETSPHAVEINYMAFRHCRDVMSESATVFQDRLAVFLEELVRAGRLRLRPDVSPAALAQLLADGARGVNQTLPPPTSAKPARAVSADVRSDPVRQLRALAHRVGLACAIASPHGANWPLAQRRSG